MLFSDLSWVWEGYQRLSGGRQYGYASPQRLTLTEILNYCKEKRFGFEDKWEFVHYVQFLDNLFMKDFQARQPTKPSK